jgi:hypothetical protein
MGYMRLHSREVGSPLFQDPTDRSPETCWQQRFDIVPFAVRRIALPIEGDMGKSYRHIFVFRVLQGQERSGIAVGSMVGVAVEAGMT